MIEKKTEKEIGVWELNKVHNISCEKGFKGLPDNCIDIIITSPPYWGQRGDDGIGLEEDPRDYVNNLVNIFTEALRVLKPSGLIWLNIGDAYNTPINWTEEAYIYSTLGPKGNGLPSTNSAYTKKRGKRRAFIDKSDKWLQYGNLLALPYRIVIGLCDKGALYRGEIIWVKGKAMPEGRCRRPHRKHESIYLFSKSEDHFFTTTPPVSSVWNLKGGMNSTQHTSTFPEDLPYNCILASGIETGLVLDPFMGSGTTGIVANKLGFDFLGFELNKVNAELANNRILSVGGLFN
ncbi:MAG: DNA-methyltransferase [Bacteroidia bacterium]